MKKMLAIFFFLFIPSSYALASGFCIKHIKNDSFELKKQGSSMGCKKEFFLNQNTYPNIYNKIYQKYKNENNWVENKKLNILDLLLLLEDSNIQQIINVEFQEIIKISKTKKINKNEKKVSIDKNEEIKNKKDKSKKILFNFKNENQNDFFDISKQYDVEYNIKMLGEYNSNFENFEMIHEGLINKWGKNCKSFNCRQNRSSKKMSEIFKNKKKQEKNPGLIFFGMAHFEVYYQYKLKKNQKNIVNIKKLINKENVPWYSKRKKEIISLIKLNKTRIKLRNSLGMSIFTDPVEAINTFWTMGNFMQQSNIINLEVSDEIKERRKLINKYKDTILKIKQEYEQNKEKEMFEKIKSL